ncbi:MAG TPA: polysaccharide biosynthesis/export family protein [Xanthobacteraceae bacterium]|nr:polysaccharide biosynthesis/export family protein [Xanthobacteraceae bacterium]
MLVAAALAAGCARQSPRPAALAVQPVSELDAYTYAGPRGIAQSVATATPVAVTRAAPPSAYTLDAGDKLRVVVFGQDGLTNSYSVDAGGSITMPLIGAVKARGLTTSELSAAIAARLRQGFIRDPAVAVEVETYRPFFILGEVTYPGQYPYVANMTVETAVAIAGGYSPRAFREQVTITRTTHGETIRSTVPTTAQVRPGDTINVAERWF